MDTLVKKAYENWEQVIEYDGKSLLGFKQNKRPSGSRNELQIGSSNYSNASDNQLPLSHLPVVPSEQQTSLNPGLPVLGKHE